MNSYGLVTIVVPVYNVELYVERCIESLVSQTYKDIEIILVDDGSTDESGAICDLWKEKDKRISVIHTQNNGVSNARNVALDISKGRYITFVDSDDCIAVDWIEFALDELNMAKADIFIGGFLRMYADGSTHRVHRIMPRQVLTNVDCLLEMYAKNFKDTCFAWEVCGKLFSSDLFTNIRFATNISSQEDGQVFWQLLREAGTIIYSPECKYYYYYREDSVVNNPSIKNVYDSYKVNEFFYKNPWHNNAIITECMRTKYYMSRLTFLLLAASNREYEYIYLEEREKMLQDLSQHLNIEWRVNKIIGIVKVIVVSMPHGILKYLSRLYRKYRI